MAPTKICVFFASIASQKCHSEVQRLPCSRLCCCVFLSVLSKSEEHVENYYCCRFDGILVPECHRLQGEDPIHGRLNYELKVFIPWKAGSGQCERGSDSSARPYGAQAPLILYTILPCCRCCPFWG